MIKLACLSTKLSLIPSASEDYISRGSFQITFPPGSRRQLFNVTIVDDFLPENTEFFNADVNLAIPEPAFMITIESPKQPLIEILDLEDSKYKVL